MDWCIQFREIREVGSKHGSGVRYVAGKRYVLNDLGLLALHEATENH